jgi:hypothetical protein
MNNIDRAIEDYKKAEKNFEEWAENGFQKDIPRIITPMDTLIVLKMDWNERVEILKANGFIYAGDRYIHNSTKKDFWVTDIKMLDDRQFQQFIRTKCIYKEIV